ncbi:Outer membrane protein assembly factor BamA [Parapedobacter luteus]|uniref:Outer membrane protein assembly factor BamA n=1 Tax=Parapedobacter luteus TaxID=623280 RepID=A0A1T5AEF6_9SPHI|nr:BamA/TamA family outer membrane protein [Parapedobacter luteus]SKB33354.1 Outer membrane protein assembly factor BamA [Parapedobacter luteus]
MNGMRTYSKKKGGVMSNRLVSLCYVAFALLCLASCSNLKYLPEGEHLYVKGEVEINSDTIPERYIGPLSEGLEALLRPKPNTTILGMRPQLYLYNIAGEPKSDRGFRNWLKNKVGQPPVLLSDVNREYNENVLRNRLENLGFFHAQVASDTTIDNRKATVTYTATPHIIYRIKSVTFDVDSSDLGKAIKSAASGSLLQVGRPYNLDNIIAERERIDNELKNKGYYYFNPDHLIVEVDSVAGDHQVDLYVMVKNETPARAKRPYYINNIYIYPNYTLTQRGYQRADPTDGNVYQGYHFIDPEHTFRRFALTNAMILRQGELYTRERHNRTIRQLVGMGSFRFVRNEFVDVDSAGKTTNKLDAYYYLTPMPKHGLRIELLGKTAAVYNGSEINVNWQHRNAFRSAELLTFTVYGGFETQTGGNVNLNSSFYRYGIEASLSFPRMIAPFDWKPTRRFVPRTVFTAGYEFLNRRTAYSLNSMRFSFGYMWRENTEKEHDLKVLEIAYVQPWNITDAYQALMDTVPPLRHAIEPQFTFGPIYNYTRTNTARTDLKHTFYFKGGLDLSANLYGLIRGANVREGRQYQIFNANFSQYIKSEVDFRHYMKLGTNATLASRAMAGLGYSYGNSTQLPYVKQFFSGGPNGIRAFRARTLGPGSYTPEFYGENNFFADQTGDIKIELNTEYRARLNSIVHWAAFVDAGNVWLQNSDPEKPGAAFSSNFVNEMAVGAGLGLRFDFTFLILRGDLAMPLRIPYRPKGERWLFDEINFRSPDWRRNNLVFNLAIGYPF